MTEAEIYDAVIMSGTADFGLVVASLRLHGAGWCVVGGMAVNSYATPVYTADLDLVVLANDLAPVLADLRSAGWRLQEFAYSVNAQRRAGPTERTDSMLMVQFSKPAEMQPFVDRAVLRPIFGLDVPVAALPDLVAAKLAAWTEPRRRPNKRRKDELDLLRLAEAYPEVVDGLLPATLRTQAQADREQIARQPDDGWGGENEMDRSRCP
jgi:hypothetical protein